MTPRDNHRQLSLLQRRHATGHRRVHHISAFLSNLGSKRAACNGAHGAHVDEELAGAESCQQSVRPIRDGLYGLGVGDHHQSHVRCRRDRTGRVFPPHATIDQPLCFRTSTIVACYDMPFVEQTAHHLAAHHSESYKSKIRHSTWPPDRKWIPKRVCVATQDCLWVTALVVSGSEPSAVT